MRLHMPGHAGGKGFPVPPLQQVAAFDVTEVPGMDDLHMPEDIIEESRRLLAQAFGARESFFLVNGATAGIQALFLTLPRGSRVLVPRNAHRSFFGGMVLAGVDPVYVPVSIETETGAVLAIDPSEVEQALEQHRPQAVFLTSPTYHGTTSDIQTLGQLAHSRQIPIYIDEAHGAHFAFHSRFPMPALKAGADAVVHGLHKTLPVFNQGAALHLGEHFPFPQRLRASLSLLTTTSPSYPLLVSIERARHFMQRQGASWLESAFQLSREYSQRINRLPGLRCPGLDILKYPGVAGADPLKILVVLDHISLNGWQVDHILRNRYGIQVEMADEHTVLAMMSMFHNRDDWERFYRGLESVSQEYRSPKANGRKKDLARLPWPVVVKNPREAFLAPRQRIPWNQAKGRISAETVAAYPPGIPGLLPGELITGEVLEYLDYVRKMNIRVQGPQDPTLTTLAVLEI